MACNENVRHSHVIKLLYGATLFYGATEQREVGKNRKRKNNLYTFCNQTTLTQCQVIKSVFWNNTKIVRSIYSAAPEVCVKSVRA